MSDSPLAMSDSDFLEYVGSNKHEEQTQTPEEVEQPAQSQVEEEQVQEPTEAVEVDSPTEQSSEVKEPEEKQEETPFDYRQFYDQVMTPIKANGKTVELHSPDEAIKLMQMGANYTKKMQTLQPYRKLLMMLENNGLLDEQKISYLIDLEKKNPEAIKKLVKESSIDPLDISMDEEDKYVPGYHKVSDEQVAFVAALDNLKETPNGNDTIYEVNSNWDEQSKDALWKNPELLETIHSQRENGIYAKITNEIQRRRVLGGIPNNVPFLQAYKIVGDELNAAGAFNTNVPLTTKAQAPKPKLSNNAKAQAAASTKTNSTKSNKFINPLAISDDDFLKQMANRV